MSQRFKAPKTPPADPEVNLGRPPNANSQPPRHGLRGACAVGAIGTGG